MSTFAEPSDARSLAGRRALVLGASGFPGSVGSARLLTRAHGQTMHAAVRDRSEAPRSWTAGSSRDSSRRGSHGGRRGLADPRARRARGDLQSRRLRRPREREESASALTERLDSPVGSACVERTRASWTGMQLVHAGSALEYQEAEAISARARFVARPRSTEKRSSGDGCAIAGTTDLRGGHRARIFTRLRTGRGARPAPASLADAADGSGEIPLGPNGTAARFLYVEDVAKALVRLACARRAAREIINLATQRNALGRPHIALAAAPPQRGRRRLRFREPFPFGPARDGP